MAYSNSGVPVRLALALLVLPGWACATAINTASEDSSPLGVTGSGHGGHGGSASSSAMEIRSGAANAGTPSAMGNGASGGSAAGAPGGAGKNGSGSGGTGSAGATGKAGASSAGSPSGGASHGGASAGGATGVSGMGSTSTGGASAGTTGSAGAGVAGSASGVTCDAAHATITFTQQSNKTIKANDCVRLVVDKTWATIGVKLQPLPGTTYPVPFTFFNCGGNGTGSLIGDYKEAVLKSGPNPGCDFFVQFGGGETPVNVTYYD